ncbi:MAG: SRPBCC family protein [Chitinophagaceae bacterium]
MKTNLIAKAAVNISASAEQVWEGLVNPTLVKKYMMGATVQSDWKKGSKIIWKGEVKGKKFEDKGEIVAIDPSKEIKYTHFSQLSGQEDKPENYHTVDIHLSGSGKETKVELTQDNNASSKEKEESEKNWKTMLEGLKQTVEAN